jgi:hypothetical protein
MSIKTKMLTGVFTALTAGALVSISTAPSYADIKCQPTSHGRPVCINVPHDYYQHRKCYYLPTVNNGRVTGVHPVCS